MTAASRRLRTRKPEQVARRAVGPVEVLDDEQDRRPGGQSLQDAEQQLEQATLGRTDAQAGGGSSATGPRSGRSRASSDAALAEHGLQFVGRDSPDQPAQRLDHRGVRQRAVTEHDAAAEQHVDAVGPRQLGELGHQPCLADRRPRPRSGSCCSGRSRASWSAARSRSISIDRPMRTGLETREAMSSIIRPVTEVARCRRRRIVPCHWGVPRAVRGSVCDRVRIRRRRVRPNPRGPRATWWVLSRSCRARRRSLHASRRSLRASRRRRRSPRR